MHSELNKVDRPKTLNDMAYDQLKLALMEGEFLPGQQISTRKAAEAMGMSSTPVREAIGRLVTERALRQTGPRSVHVPVLTSEEIKEILAIRLKLEGLAAERAASLIGREELAQLSVISQEHANAQANGDRRKALQINQRFHFAIYDLSGMPSLKAIIETLWVQIGPSLNLLYTSGPIRSVGAENHRRIIQALKSGDPQASRLAVAKDLKDGAAAILVRIVETEAATEPQRQGIYWK